MIDLLATLVVYQHVNSLEHSVKNPWTGDYLARQLYPRTLVQYHTYHPRLQLCLGLGR